MIKRMAASMYKGRVVPCTLTLCFGDSNTFGYDAGSRLGRQLKERERWPEVFAGLIGWDLVNEGMNGREIPAGWFLERFDKILEEDAPFDVLAVMLGTNDILNSFQPDAAEAGRNMEAFLLHALNHPQIQGEGQKLFTRKLFEALSE